MQLRLPPDGRRTRADAPRPGRRPLDPRVLTVHRVGALAVAAVIGSSACWASPAAWTSSPPSGEPILGMSSNGLLSTISVAHRRPC